MIRDLEQELERFKALLPRPFRRSPQVFEELLVGMLKVFSYDLGRLCIGL